MDESAALPMQRRGSIPTFDSNIAERIGIQLGLISLTPWVRLPPPPQFGSIGPLVGEPSCHLGKIRSSTLHSTANAKCSIMVYYTSLVKRKCGSNPTHGSIVFTIPLVKSRSTNRWASCKSRGQGVTYVLNSPLSILPPSSSGLRPMCYIHKTVVRFHPEVQLSVGIIGKT